MKKTKKKGAKKTSNTSNTKNETPMFQDPAKPLWSDESKYFHLIDNMDLDAKWKKTLKDILRTTFRIGERVVEIGKKIIEFICIALKKFPKTTAVLVVGSVLIMLSTGIPVLHWILTPIIAALTITVASIVLVSEAMNQSMEEWFGSFKGLKAT